jgi:hypothetical protein
MEEQKINSKEVKMQPMAGGKQDTKENPQEKLPYDKLKEIADSLWNENRYLKQQLQGASETLRSINRLDYLFKVAEFAYREGKFNFSPDFVESCFEEIEKIMTPPEEEVKEAEKEN